MIGRVKAWLADAVRRFALDKAGNVAMIFGLSLIPLMAAGGVAVDMSRAMIVRHRLSEALDAAGLAAGRQYDDGLDAVTAVAQQYFNANYPAAELGVPGVLQVSMDGGKISLTATAEVDTTLMNLVGFDYLDVGVSSEIVRDGKSVELALALDVTGSMAGQKIIDLKTAAKDLIDTVVWDDQDQFYSKVAIVPFAVGVNVGSTYANSVRGTPTAAKSITGATWGKAITGASWSTGTAKNITGATSFTGTAKNISGATRANPVVVTTSAAHGFSTGQVIWISGVSGMTQINNKYFTITVTSSTKFSLGVNGSSYSNYTSGGTSRQCTYAGCEVGITTSTTHGFANGDSVYITGVGGMTTINNRQFTVANASGSTFSLSAENGATYSSYTSGGTATKCALTSCNVVVTAASHGFSSGNTVYISGVGGMTQLNGNNYTIANITTNTFSLNSTSGYNFSTYTSGGRVCVTTNCPVTITSNGHGFSNGSYVYITGVGGMTQINNAAFAVANATTNTFDLSGINGSTYSTYTSGGNAYCTTSGCQYYRFLDAAGTPSYHVYQINNCATERVGTNAYNDVAPSTSLVGRNYTSSGTACVTNQIVPLSTDRTYLKAQIDLFAAGGSTAGHIGLAWGWYMLSPNFAYLFPTASQAAAYTAPKTLKIAVLMTDGEFNTAYCNGVVAQDSTNGTASQHINCNATNGSPMTQAETLCESIKSAGVELYTVGFQLGAVPEAIDLLDSCATNADHAFVADDGAELLAAFQQIGENISELRVSK